MGGLKRSIKIEEIEKKTVKSVAFTKRRNGLFRKATDLCLLCPDTQIAILATPPSTNSHASFYTFGHSSVDNVVSALLQDRSPLPINQQNMSGSEFWWEDERFNMSENVEELKDAIDAVSRMLNSARLRLDNEKSDHGASVTYQKDDFDELCNCDTTTNNYEEAMNQVPNLEGASTSSGTLVQIGEGNYNFDDMLNDIDPLLDPVLS